VDPERLTAGDTEVLVDLLRRTGERWETDDARVQAALFFDPYAACVTRPVAAALIVGAPLPDVRASACTVEFDEYGLALAVRVEAAVEASDPLDTARQVLVDGHLLPLVDALTAVTPLGRPALTAMIADALASTLLDAGDASEARRLAVELSARCAPDLPGPPRFMTVRRADGPRAVHLRRSCCLAYQLAGAVHCAPCPLPDDRTRTHRLGGATAD
jgi:ferric iron reductase protein FhuF